MGSLTSPPFRRLAIVGVGLVGGSLGLAIKRRWPDVRVTAIDTAAVGAEAVRRQAADCAGEDVASAGDADLVVLAAPVAVNLGLLPRLAASVPAGTLVTDTGGTKRDMMAAAATLDGRLCFVGGHPIAGAARSGLAAARDDLFRDRPWILTPGDGRTVPPALRALVEGTGAIVRVMAADEHDRLLSAVSHLPQLAASALMHVVGTAAGADGLALAGPGLRDTTRLAASPADIWADIAATNRDFLGADLDALIATLQDLRREIGGSGAALARTFDSAAAWRRVLEPDVEPR